MIPIWTLKLGSVAVTAASTVGFWNFVMSHVKPTRAPLHPKVAQPAVQDDSASKWTMVDDPSSTAPAATQQQPAVTRIVVVQQATQSHVQSQAAVGARWIAGQTGAKPVTYSSVS